MLCHLWDLLFVQLFLYCSQLNVLKSAASFQYAIIFFSELSSLTQLLGQPCVLVSKKVLIYPEYTGNERYLRQSRI